MNRVLAAFLVALALTTAFAQKPARTGFHQSVHVGKVVSVRSDRLVKFHEPRLTPPVVRPPEHRGGEWRWHRSYGWINLPVGASPTLLLPETFTLPQTVTTYEIPQVEASVTVICPHCGLPVVVQLPK